MRNFLVTAALALATATPALAQDTGPADPAATASNSDSSDSNDAPARSPDGSRAFGIEPYVGVLGGYEWFDSQPNKAGIPLQANKLEGSLVQGVVGVNIPLNAFFIGAEGNVAKGVSGDIDWQYGAAGRFGFRAGESGLIYGKVGYQWVNFDRFGEDSRDYHAVTYGAGFEVGPKSVGLGGLTGNSGIRIRGEVSTFGNAKSFRPMLGLVGHF